MMLTTDIFIRCEELVFKLNCQHSESLSVPENGSLCLKLDFLYCRGNCFPFKDCVDKKMQCKNSEIWNKENAWVPG